MGEETRRRRCISPAALPDDDDLLGEILLRLPATPSSIPRASLVCKRWRRLATDAGFLRRFRVRHRKDAPLLGVFFEERAAGMRKKELPFVPALDAPDRIPPGRFSLRLDDDDDLDSGGGSAGGSWSVLGCRHGRVLVINRARPELLVFDPVAGDRRRVAFAPPPFLVKAFHANAAVLCYDEDGGHGRSGSAFKLVFVATSDKGGEKALARVYSSETGVWGEPVSTAEPCVGHVGRRPGTLAGNALYWWLNASSDGILKFDLGTQRLAVIKRPPFTGISSGCSRIIRAEDSTGVGFAVLSYPSFQTWDRKVDRLGVASWQLRKTVNMHKVLGLPSMIEAWMAGIVGYDEDADAILISVHTCVYSHVFVVQLDSMQSRKLRGSFSGNAYHPFTSFYTAGTVARSAPSH